MSSTPFIAVEGPIGVGKTSLAKAIAEHYNFQLLKEIVEENPFLGKFYDNIDEWSFQTEMFFFATGINSLKRLMVNTFQSRYLSFLIIIFSRTVFLLVVR